MDNNRTQECPNATTDDAVNFACPPSLVDSGADCNPASAAEHTINRQLYDALNGILDNLIGKESRWTISLHVPIRQYHHYRGPRSDTMSPTRRVRFHSIKHVRGALGKRNFRNCDYEEECSLMPKRKHWLEDKQAESLSINERLSVSKTTAPTSSRKPTYVPQDGSMPLFTPFETTIMQPVIPPISKEAHTDKCHTTITAAEKNFVENFVECCFNAVMTHLRQVCSTAEHAITQRISDAEINSCEEEQLCGEYNATRDIMLVNEPQLNDTHELSAKMGGEQQLSEAYNSSAGAEIGYFCEETDLVSSKGIEISLEFEDRSQQLETKSRLLAGFTNDASIVADSSIFERVALAGCTRARDILLPSLRIFETTITVSVDACQNILLSPQKTDIDIVQLHRRNEVVTIDRNIEDKSHLSSFKRGYQQETPIIASDVDADSGAKDSCKENFEVLEKRSVPQSHVDLLQNSDGSDFSATEKDTAPRRLSVLERVALKEQQMKQLMSPQMLILDDVKHRKRAASLIARNSLNYQNTEGAQTSTIVFHGISVRERVMLKERELKEIESLPVSKFSSKFLHGSHHATRRSISDPKECRREKHDVTAGYIAHTSSLHRKSELMSTPVLPTNNSKMKGTLSDENSITSRNLRLDSEIVHEAALRLTNHSSFINQHVQNAALQRDAPENIRRERKQYPSTQAPIEGNCAEDNEQETRTEQVNVHEDGNVDLTQGNVISSQCRVSEGSLSRDFMQQNSWPTDWSHRFHKIRLIFENGYLEGRKYLDDLRISDEKKKFLDFDNDPESQKVCQKANGDIIASNDTVEPEAIHSSKERSQNCESDEVSDVDINVATNDRQIPAPKAAAKLSLREAESPSTSDQDLSSDKHIGGDRNQGAGNEHETNRAVAKEVEFYRRSVKHLIRLKEDQIMRMEEADEQECPPSRLKTLCEEYGPIKDHLSEKRKVRKESAKVSSPAVMIRRKDTPPATPTTPVRRSLLLGFARSSEATTSFNEADEVGYAKNEEKKATVQSVLYSPGSIPQIAVQVVEQPLGRANIVDNVDIAPKSSYDASISADASLISADQQRTAVSMEQTPLADTKSEASENGKRMANDQIKIVSEPVKWEQGFSSAVIRQMSRSNKWIPVEEEDEQVRLRREEFHSRSHAPSLRDEKGREKPHVHKVSSISSGSLDVKRKANVMSDDARSKSPALVNMHRVGGAYSRSLSFNGVSSLPQQTPALIPQLSRNKRPASLHLNEHATSDSKPHSPTVTPAWSPAHSYVPPTSPRRPMKDRNPPLSPRHHYVPMLHHNFSRPTSPSIVIRPSRSRTFELFSQFAERPARIDGLNTKRHSLPLFTREASEEDRDRSNKRTSIGVTSPISGVATLTSPSLVGEQARTFPRVNRHPYVPRIERLHREDDKQTSLTPTFRPQNEDTLTASSFSLPLQQNVGYSRSVTESDLNAGRLKNSGSLVETASGSERFISGSNYANSELSKSTPNVAQILSPPPSRSSFHQPIYDSLPSYLSKSALSPSPFAETIKSSAKSTVKNSQGGAISALSSNNPLSPSRTEKRGANSTAEAVDFFEPTDRVENIQRPPEFSLPLTREPVLSLTAELQSSPVSTKSSLPGGSLGDYYRIFQPTAYRSPDQDFIRHEVKVVQEHSPVEHRSSKPVPVAVASSASQKFLRHKATSLPVPTSPLQQSSEVPSSPLNRRLVYKEFAALQPAKVTRTTSQGSYSNPEQQDRSALSSSVNEKLLHEEARTTPLSPPLGHNLLVGKSPVKSSASYKISVVEPLSPLSTQVNADSVSQSTVRRSTISGPPSNAQLDEKENVERFGPIKERFKNATLFFEEKAAEIQRANRSLKPKPITYKFTPFKSPTSSVRYIPIAQSPSFANGSFALMPAVNVSPPAQVVNNVLLEKFDAEDSPGCAQWNPKLLIDKLYEIDYSPRKESKRNRFTNMEGHLDVPVDDKNIIAELQKSWTQKYFRTRDGRLQWFASHFADDYPVGEILLSGCEVDANKEEGTLSICGGRDRVKVIVRVPLTSNLFDKWRKAITSHSASSYLDSFVHPVYPQLPHINEKVAIIELGSCSIRAGVLTMEPSLPQSFFPAIVLVKANGETMVGADALSPENRHSGELIRPIHSSDPTLERYSINKVALKACFQKCITDLRIDPRRYRVLLSIPQNIPTVLIADILKIVLQELRFLGAAISRQPSLILYSYDVTTGVVVDIGDRLNIVPVIDGYVLDSATVSLPYGALQITNALQAKLAETNNGLYTFRSPVERLILRYIMEQACYVSTSFEEDVKKCRDRLENVDLIVSLDEFQPTSEMLSTFKIDSARFTAPEGLFKPNRWGLDIKALHQLIHEAIQLAPIDSRKTLLRNIYLAGGASLLPGLAERLELEISALVAPTIHTQVHLSPWRYNAAYLGAQIIASSTQFDTTCVTLDNLNEFINQLQCSTF